MKKLFFAILALCLVFVFTQCEQKEEVDNRTIITKKIQYDVPIVNDNPDYDWWIGNIEGSDREQLLENIFDKVKTGEVTAYDYFNEPMSLEQIGQLLVDSLQMTLQRPYDPYEEYDTLIIKKILPSDVSHLRFLEEWKYDEESLHIDKKVSALCPVLQVKVNNQLLTRPLFWVYFEELK